MRRWIPVIAIIFLSGCASIRAEQRMSEFDDLTRAYGSAMQWSEFVAAYSAMQKTATTPPLDASLYKDIKVTSYEPQRLRAAEDAKAKTIRRTVHIGYVHLVDMVEHSLTTDEEWVYSDTDERWYLRSGFPVFK